MSSDQAILPGDPPISVRLRRSAQARRMSLRVSRLDGRVTLSLPRWTPEREALDFMHEKADWIRKHLAARPDDTHVAIGRDILFEGRETPIVAGTGRSARVLDGQIAVPERAASAGTRVAALFKLLARDRLQSASDHYAARLGVSYSGLSIRDTRSRWGSCSTEGRLMYSWRLVMAPPEVLDYVAAHEVSHLLEMNHSPAYWAVVSRIYPEYSKPRSWLRRHGQGLHAYRFDD